MDRNSAKWSFNAFQSMADSLTNQKVIKKKIRFGSRDLHINFQLSIFETIDESRFTNIVTNWRTDRRTYKERYSIRMLWVGGMPQTRKCVTHYNSQWGSSDKIRAIKGLFVCYALYHWYDWRTKSLALTVKSRCNSAIRDFNIKFNSITTR